MKKKITLALSALCFASLVIFSGCVDSESIATNQIEDSKGLYIQLEWSTGSSATFALEEANLSLGLFKGDIEVESSLREFAFEEVRLTGLLSDGAYRVAVKVDSARKNTDFTVYMIGQESESFISHTGSFSLADAAQKLELPQFLTIQKRGSRYTIFK